MSEVVSGRPMKPMNRRRAFLWRAISVLLALLILLVLALMWWWDTEPADFDVVKNAEQHAAQHHHRVVPGTTTTATLIEVSRILLEKRGGYLANDILPPGVLMDNVPNWEKGVVLQIRDLALSMRNDFARSQSQSVEDDDLRDALNFFSYKHQHWIFPSSENQYRNGIERTEAYLKRLGDDNEEDGQFFARADNLEAYLELVNKRLGSLSQRLSASVGQDRINTDLAGDPNAQQAKPQPAEQRVKTPWLQIDDVFYEARGSTWALLHFLRAVRHDFEPVLRDKNALVSMDQVIRELEESQEPLSSPIVLNGSPYGFFANHSLVMANYVSRANAALIDLRRLLENG
ncbi:MAG: DUF2333 family protein [Lysobacteraceae bacterium]|nr:DUF2333 family protein [Xanthomonadaceae bacterium]HRX99006.1 DUF2333 family protein [Xanthomonadaceae bacterium]